MEKLPTPESVLKLFHRIATVDGGYIPVEEPVEEKNDDGKKTAKGSKKNNNKRGINSNDMKQQNDNRIEEKTATEESKSSPGNANARKVTFDNFMAATHFIYGDSFTHFDAFRGFTSAIQQHRLTSRFDEAPPELLQISIEHNSAPPASASGSACSCWWLSPWD